MTSTAMKVLFMSRLAIWMALRTVSTKIEIAKLELGSGTAAWTAQAHATVLGTYKLSQEHKLAVYRLKWKVGALSLCRESL